MPRLYPRPIALRDLRFEVDVELRFPPPAADLLDRVRPELMQVVRLADLHRAVVVLLCARAGLDVVERFDAAAPAEAARAHDAVDRARMQVGHVLPADDPATANSRSSTWDPA